MAQLLVRNLPDDLVQALKARATQNGRSAEAEHRAILQEALQPEAPAKSFKAMLLEIPTSGEEHDDAFERPADYGRDIDL